MRITNGSVTYSRVVKDADYGVNRKAEFTLSFTLDEHEQLAEEELLALAGKIALRHVVGMLDIPTPTDIRPVKPVSTADAPAAVPSAAVPPGGGDVPRRGRPPKERLTPPVQPEMPLAYPRHVAVAEPAPVVPVVAATPAVATPAAEVITDDMLQHACQQLARTKGQFAIREKSAQQPWWLKTVRDCPLDQRAAFLAVLQALPDKFPS